LLITHLEFVVNYWDGGIQLEEGERQLNFDGGVLLLQAVILFLKLINY
jgi:hypothetical protein